MSLSSRVFLDDIRKFSGFMSLWATLCECMYFKHFTTWMKISRALVSPKVPFFSSLSKSSPPSQKLLCRQVTLQPNKCSFRLRRTRKAWRPWGGRACAWFRFHCARSKGFWLVFWRWAWRLGKYAGAACGVPYRLSRRHRGRWSRLGGTCLRWELVEQPDVFFARSDEKILLY